MKKIQLIVLAAAAMLAVSCGSDKTAQVPQNDSTSAVLDNIKARYSVRSYTGEKISKEQIDTLLQAAMAAPTGMNVQPWRFVVVQDDAQLEAIGGRLNTAAGTAIVVCGETVTDKGEANNVWFLDCSAATENLLLAAKAMGLGAVWTAAYPFEERMNPIIEALGLPDTVKPLAVVPVGYEQGTGEPKQKFDATKIHYDCW